MQGRWDQAKQRATDAEELIIGEPPPAFHMAEHALAVVDYYAGDYAGAERRYAAIVADDRVALPWRLMADMERGSAVARGGNVSSGRAITAAALARAEAEAGETVVAWGSYVLGSIDLVDEPASALEAFDRAIAKARDSQTVLVEQFAGVGRIAALIGGDRHGEAAAAVPSVLDSLVRHGNRTHLWSLARLVCLIAIESGDVESAALLAGAMEYDAAAPLASSIVAATSELEELANRLGEARWADTRRRAEAMDLRQVTALMRKVADNYTGRRTRDTKP
jgi:hypothetical protein